MQTKKDLLKYPSHPEFEELLYSCGSMTKQLEALGHKLTVKLIFEGIEEQYYRRYVTLNLNNIPVVLACSSTKLANSFFVDLLKNASTTPIGKFLFASGSQVKRREKMRMNLLSSNQIKPPKLVSALTSNHYQNNQNFWCRNSTFELGKETLDLIEILLPELDTFF